MSKEESIKSWCPACHSHNTVFIGAGGYLTCSWIECPEPDYLKAWTQHVENVRGATRDLYLKELNYWKSLAEKLMERSQYETEPKMVIEANPKSQIFIDAVPRREPAEKGVSDDTRRYRT